MTNISKIMLAALVAAPMLCTGAQAADYDVTTLGSGADFTGCLATNKNNTIGLLAVGSSVAILATPQGLTVAKGAKISGTWSVDDGDANAIDTTVTTANAVSMDVPNSAEAVQALVSGKTLTVKVDGKSYAMPLGDMTQAFTSLSECMVKNQK